MEQVFNILVIGGGPAGASASIILARAGFEVALIERSNYDKIRIGETLLPQTRILLEQLGAWEIFLENNHLPSPGTISIWGDNTFRENDFILNPYGQGWHIDRLQFDISLARLAEKTGVKVYKATRVLSYLSLSPNKWQVKTISDGRLCTFQASMLVDATGRSSSVASKKSIKRIIYDRLIGIVKFGSNKANLETNDSRTFVEAVETGWWYSALLPQNRFVISFMTDSDLLPERSESLNQYWLKELSETQFAKRYANTEVQKSDICILSANTSSLEKVADSSWLAVGDAATAFDPLSSLGISYAIDSGIRGAQAIYQQASGNSSDILNYQKWSENFIKEFLKTRTKYYRLEQRWANSLFWQRRHNPPAHRANTKEHI